MKKSSESKILLISIWGALLFSVTGIVWGVLAHSRMIFFDGIYSFVSLVLSLGSYWAFHFMRREEPGSFQFGKDSMEPLVVIFKGLVLGGLSIYAIVTALTDISSGGRMVQLTSATVYSVFSTVLCWLIYRMIRHRGRSLRSELTGAEGAQWLMDTVLSAAVLLGFLAAWVLGYTRWAYLIPYVDPLMVLAFGVYFLKIPYVILRNNLRELLMMAPSRELQSHINQAVGKMEKQYGFSGSYVRTAKIGRKLVIEIDFIVDRYCRVHDIRQCDVVREALKRQLGSAHYGAWLTVSFTENRKWAV